MLKFSLIEKDLINVSIIFESLRLALPKNEESSQVHGLIVMETGQIPL